MAKKIETKKELIKKKPTRQKIIISQGKAMGNPQIPFKILYTEIVGNAEIAKERIKELMKEFENIEGLSVSYFSL